MVVLGAGLIIAHDMLSFSIIFFVSTAWALRASRERELQKTNEPDEVANAGPLRTSISSGGAKKQRKDCQGQSKTRPLWRSKTRPVGSDEVVGFAG
jgi:hypothetical protein